MKRILLSESPETVELLASWLDDKVSLSSRQRSVLALTLLERKEPKIKRGALFRVLKSFSTPEDADAMRDALIEAGLLIQTGDDGYGPYEIHFEAAGIDVDAVMEQLRAEIAEEEAEDASDEEADEDSTDADDEEPEDAAGEEEAAVPVEDVPAAKEAAEEDNQGSRQPGAGDGEAEGLSDSKADAEVPRKPAPATRSRSRRRHCRTTEQESADEPAAIEEEAPASGSDADRPERAPKRKTKAKEPAAERKADNEARKPKASRKKGDAAAQDGQAKRPSSKQEKALKKRDDKQASESPSIIRRGIGLLGSVRDRVLSLRSDTPAGQQAADNARPTKSGKRPENKGKNAQAPAKREKRPDDFDRVRAWLATHEGETIPYATRRQRAFQIFSDEKALEGKRGERLMRRMSAKGMTTNVLRIASRQLTPLQGFYTLGADQPFLVVENIDTYEEVVTLLRGQRSIRLFGTRIGGVIFGAGHNILIAHALDEYLHNIGYRYDYVYYAGDIDREGARLVERAREVNVTEIRLHAGIYRAMLAAQRAHVRAGGNGESAADNQDIPRDFTRLVKDLPPALRIPFRRALRDNIRIPQEILTSEDFRRASMNRIDKLLDR